MQTMLQDQLPLQVREQLRAVLQAGHLNMRGVCIALEHERMHQETLAYMQAQQRRIAFEALMQAGDIELQQQQHCNGHASSNGQLANGLAAGRQLSNASGNGVAQSQETGANAMKYCPAGTVMLGVDTASSVSGFVWDNEGPEQVSIVGIPA